MHARYHYDDPASTGKDRIAHRQQTAEPIFCIGREFDRYDFSLKPKSFDQAIRDRLWQLRHSGKYLRFWFSGGKDSRLILDNALREGIDFDEIVIIKNQIMGPLYHLGAIVEIQSNAIDYIETIKSKLHRTRLTLIDFQDSEYQAVFSHADWINHTNVYYIHSAIEPPLFYQYVNPEFGYLEDVSDRIDLMGSVHPHVYWDDGWCFVYVDQQFPQNLWHTCENFLTSPEDPGIAHAYVSAVCAELNKRDLRPHRFQKDIFSDGNQNLRGIRGLLPQYQFDIHRPDHEWPKNYLDPWRPTDEPFWRANPSYKSFLSCLLCYFAAPDNPGFNHYRNTTHWQKVCAELDYGGICTKEFRLN